ncbi:MAG: hypothetical protein EZS28_007161 [Streblomastix strix]|uniref:Uncharacterized protein n=1 Tax=Streblomastix strix TaxID=222440 RepID=A0A5J4WQ92_9EUKA|nr:MAG: hypothetical protein EZS28_007161 [Streblomastix strix]
MKVKQQITMLRKEMILFDDVGIIPFYSNSESSKLSYLKKFKAAFRQLFVGFKVADYDPTGKRPTKYELEALEDRIQATLGLEINKNGDFEKASNLELELEADVCKLAVDCHRASATAIASLARNDAEQVTDRLLTSHHLARVIAVQAKQLREQSLAPPIFMGLLDPDVSVSDIFGKKSKLGSFNSFRGWGRCRGGPNKRDQLTSVTTRNIHVELGITIEPIAHITAKTVMDWGFVRPSDQPRSVENRRFRGMREQCLNIVWILERHRFRTDQR